MSREDAAIDNLVIDARGMGLGHAGRGVGRVIAELVGGLHRAGLQARVAGPTAAADLLASRGGCTWLPMRARAMNGILTAGSFAGAGRLLRLAPTIPGPLDERSVVLCYDLIPLADLDAHFPWHRRLRSPLARAAYLRSVDLYRRAGTVVAISQAVADDVVARLGVPRARVRALPLAASDAFHLDSGGPPAERRHEVLWVLGGLNANKNLDLVLAIWAGAVDLAPLTIVGGLPPRVVWRIRARAALAGAPPPRFAGRLADDTLARRMRDAHCVIVPSRAEGFGLPVSEARAAGAHVVATDLPVLKEAGDAHVTYVALDDVAAWRGAIRAAPPGAPQRARRRWDDVARELIEILAEPHAAGARSRSSAPRT